MKLILTTLLSVLLVSSIANAQHANVGIKGGVNAYTINTNNNNNFDPQLGFHVGLIGHIHLADQFAIQPELMFSTQGAQTTVLGQEVKLNLNYINIPILLQFMFDNGFRLQAGPQLGVLASAKSQINNNTNDIKDNYESIDLGLTVGVSYVNPSNNLGVDLRYNLGVSNIDKSGNSNATNRGVQAGLFYLFNHK